jgi:predicted nuclease of predicted toxin-antitoxin system
MPHKFYKHKTLLDEQISPRQYFPWLNERFDTKHIKHDLNLASLPDPEVYELARSQGRIILTKNVKDFRALLRKDSPGIIGIPEAWSNHRIDTKLTALLMKHGPNNFKGRLYSLAAEEVLREAA